MNPDREMSFVGEMRPRERIEVGRILVLDRDGVHCADAVWPDAMPPRMQPYLRTAIQVFGDIRIGDYESGLTTPVLMTLDPVPSPGQRLAFRYRLTADPGVEYALADGARADPRTG